MDRVSLHRKLACCLALVATGDGCTRPGAMLQRPVAHPAPTEHVLDPGAEQRHRDARQRWIESLHRAADGVDWRAIERANGMAEQQRRNLLGRQRHIAGAAGTWTEIGSRNLAGRMHCEALGPDGTTLYAGSALGGVWRASLDGNGWEPLGDNLYGGAHELLVLPGELPGEPPVMLVATDGGDVHLSRDDGQTWEQPDGLAGLSWVRGWGVLQDGVPTIVLYADGPASNFRPAIYASVDYGRTFTPRWQAAADWTGALWIPRSGPQAAGTIYVVHQGQLRRSVDGGFTCPVVGTIAGGADRAVLAGSEAGAPTLYAALRIAGQWQLHRSDDAGAGWAAVHAIADFWESLCASILDPGVVIYGGVEAWRSTNGGLTFAKINDWADYYGSPATRLHADIPGLYCWPNPSDPQAEQWYFCTDGGLYRSTTQGAAVTNLSLSGLGVGQYYSTLTSANLALRIVAGSQDQGYQRGFKLPPAGPGPSTPFDQLISGDYGHLTSSDGTHEVVYSTYPGFMLIQDGESFPALYFADFPKNAVSAWLPPVVAHPTDLDSVFFCGDRLHRYIRSGNTWFPTLHSAQDFSPPGSTYLSALAFAPTEPLQAYAVTNGGAIFHSEDQGVTWTAGSGMAPGQQYFYGNAIAVHPDNPLDVVVGGAGYSAPGVIRSVDGGQTWSAQTAGLPQTLVYDLAWAQDSGALYAATESGAFRWDPDSALWENIMDNVAPITIYWSVEAVGDGEIIRYGTYGRGIWDFEPAAVGQCASQGDCADLAPLDGLRDDNCVYWACAGGGCAGQDIRFADLGGGFGECAPDGSTDANDRFHALNCFANTDTLGTPGAYPCEDAPPLAYNVDAGGPFGQCCPDGVCDAHDVFHVLNAFSGDSPCACDADGGRTFACPCAEPSEPAGRPVLCPPGPGSAVPEPPADDAAAVRLALVPAQRVVEPGGAVDVDVHVLDELQDVRGYQLHIAAGGGGHGAVVLRDMSIAKRSDHVFAGRPYWEAFNLDTAQMLAGLDGPGVAAPAGTYLATLTLHVPADALGVFTIQVLYGANPAHRTFLIPTTPGRRIRIAGSEPAVIEVLRRRR